MGHWGENPWDNDSSADWFGGFIDRNNVRDYVMETIKQEYEDGMYFQLDEIHAAIAVFLMLGRIYIWPIEQYDEDLDTVLARARDLKRIVTADQEAGGRFPALDQEITILEGRLKENRKRRLEPAKWPWGMD